MRYFAWVIARKGSSTFQILSNDETIKPPGKNWPQGFYKRHPQLRPRTLRPIDWARHDIYEKVVDWFPMIGRELHDPAILPENVYNMDETGNLLSSVVSRKYVIHRDDARKYRGAAVKRTLVTSVECIRADGSCLSPLIIWPASTHRSDWTIHRTPGWHFACSPSGYSNTAIVLDWYRRVFDPQTKDRAGHRPRILINDGFGPHESLEVLQFCHENNIILCRMPSHTSHKLQPCDVAVFGPLKTAYREAVEELERGGVKIIGKQHFTLLYDQARQVAFTPHNIKSGWAKTGLFPFDPNKVLQGMQKPPAQACQSSLAVDTARTDEPLRTPVTSEHLVSLRRAIEQNVHALDDRNQQRLQKLANAAERAMSARDLLFQENSDLFKQNNESNVRASTKSTVVGKGTVMSFEEIRVAQKKRDAKDASEDRRRGRKRKNSALALTSTHSRGPKSRAKEVEEANYEIDALKMRSYCSVF